VSCKSAVFAAIGEVRHNDNKEDISLELLPVARDELTAAFIAVETF